MTEPILARRLGRILEVTYTVADTRVYAFVERMCIVIATGEVQESEAMK